MYRRMVDFFHGCLVVMVRGKKPEQLLNKAVEREICLWDIKRPAPDIIILKIRAGDFPFLRPCLRESGTRGKILRRAGLPFIARRLLRRKERLLGLVFFLIVLHIMASFVWFVTIDGGEKIGVEKIHTGLRELGIYPGMTRGRIEKDRDRLVCELAVQFPEAAWIGLEIRGVVVFVTVVERTAPPDQESIPANVVALKEGLVSEVIVLAGTPVVAEGDMVNRGDLLILGEQKLPRLDGGIETRRVRAAGIVKARVWYEIKVEEPLVIWSAVRGPQQRVELFLRYKDRFVPLYHRGEITEKNYLERQRKTIYRGRNQMNLVELIKDIYLELAWVKTRVSAEEALAGARREGETKLSFLLFSGARVQDRREEWKVTGDFLSYRLVVETLEDIARPSGCITELDEVPLPEDRAGR